MKPAASKPLQFTKRYGQMNAQYSIQDVYDALVELLTNSDDSYRRLHAAGKAEADRGQILIQLERHRAPRSSVLTVSDRAEGILDMERALLQVGDRTSASGDRGFMARGLKDCAALGHITVESIHDGSLAKAEITPNLDFVPWREKRKAHQKATARDRKRLSIPGTGNGTVVRIELDRVRVPQQTTLEKELPWHFALRDILQAEGAGRVMVRYGNKKPVQLSHVAPVGEVVIDEEFPVPGYEGQRARFRLMRSAQPLPEASDRRFRRSGVVIKGARGAYECSFLNPELERDPAAEHYLGLLDCPGIDVMAAEWDECREQGRKHPDANPLMILDPNRRDTLTRAHPFTQALLELPIERLRLEFEKDRQNRRKRRQRIEAKETTERLRKLAKEASRFMREKLEDLDTVSPGDVVDDKTFAKKGLALVPSFTQIPVGEQKRFYVKVHESLGLPLGTSVKVLLGKAAANALEVVGKPSDLEADPIHGTVLRGSFVLRALTEVRRVQIGCIVDGLDPVHAEVEVISAAPKDIPIQGDFAFHRKDYSVRERSRRTLVLRARFNPPPVPIPGFKVRLDKQKVAVIRKINPLQLVPGTTYYEGSIVLEGQRLNDTTKVIAEMGDKRASCTLTVVPKEEKGVQLTFELVPYSLGQNFRALWDRKEPNKLLITTQHESIQRYLGPVDQRYPGQHDPPFRVLLAELISDNVCRRIVEEHMKALPHEFDGNRLYLLHNRLMKEFTPLAHKIQLAQPRLNKAAQPRPPRPGAGQGKRPARSAPARPARAASR